MRCIEISSKVTKAKNYICSIYFVCIAEKSKESCTFDSWKSGLTQALHVSGLSGAPDRCAGLSSVDCLSYDRSKPTERSIKVHGSGVKFMFRSQDILLMTSQLMSAHVILMDGQASTWHGGPSSFKLFKSLFHLNICLKFALNDCSRQTQREREY